MAARSAIILTLLTMLSLVVAQKPAPTVSATRSDDTALGPAFEVAVIRPGDRSSGRRWFGMQVNDSGHFLASAVSLGDLVNAAFGAMALDRGAPKWVDSEDFDIDAKVDDAYMVHWDKMSYAQRMGVVRPMVRRLLADRFKLKLRTETRDIPVYTLVQAKRGAKMKEVPAPLSQESKNIQGVVINCPRKEESMTCMGKAVPMSQLIKLFTSFANLDVDRRVVDRTGLKGYYDYSFTVFTDADADPPMRQIEDQLGLRFEPGKTPAKVYVIESADRPSVDGAELAVP